MTNKLQDTLRAGREAAAQLNINTERLTETLAQIERSLSELRLGVEAEVPINDELALAFEKEGKIWRLLIKSVNGSHLLINASRSSRILAVAKLNDLLLALVAKTSATSAEVNEVANSAEAYLEDLRDFARRHESR